MIKNTSPAYNDTRVLLGRAGCIFYIMRKIYITLGAFASKTVLDITIHISLSNFTESCFLYTCILIDN